MGPGKTRAGFGSLGTRPPGTDNPGMEPGLVLVPTQAPPMRGVERAQALQMLGLAWDPGSVTPMLHNLGRFVNSLSLSFYISKMGKIVPTS